MKNADVTIKRLGLKHKKRWFHVIWESNMGIEPSSKPVFTLKNEFELSKMKGAASNTGNVNLETRK